MTYDVMLRCPEADKAVPTGTICDVKAFESLGSKKFTCPACGKTHQWSPSEAWLGDLLFAAMTFGERQPGAD